MNSINGPFDKKHKSEQQQTTPVSNAEVEKIKSLVSKLANTWSNDWERAWDELVAMGEHTVPHLLAFLESNEEIFALPVSFDRDVKIAAFRRVIRILGDIGDPRAIPKLRVLENSRWQDVADASHIALGALYANATSELRLDRQRPYDQVLEINLATFKARSQPYSREALHRFCLEAIDALPTLKFASSEEMAGTWTWIGSLIYKSINPEWDGSLENITRPCPEAKRCYEEALRLVPKGYNPYWEHIAEKL